MRIETSLPMFPLRSAAAAEVQEGTPEVASEPLSPPQPQQDPAAPAPADPQFESAEGMLRKLSSGHFNPVAALRHQIKHAEALRDAGIQAPEPAVPPKGRAYAKFLEQYKAMQQSAPAAPPLAEPPAGSEPLPAEPTQEPQSPTAAA